MMMMNKMPVGRTASKIARVVVANSEASAQRSLTTRSKNVVLASRSALAARHGLSKLPVMKLPQRSLVHATRPVLGAAPGTATQAELDEVTAATILWRETVTCGLPDAPEKTAALYAEDAVFWGTVSEGVRDTPELVYDYFDYFARVPGLRMVEFTPTSTRILGDFAVQAGQYTFAWENADGSTTEVLARFNFTFRKEADNWKIIHHHSSAMPAAPDALKPVEPKPDAKWIGTTPEMKAVAGKTIEWKDTVTLGTEDAPEKTAALYAPDAVFWGTVSEQVRNTPEQVYDYFDFFARVPGLRLVEYTPEPVRMFGDSFAIHAGSYVFCWDGADGETVRVKARFTFSYRKEADGSWKIIEHHSSKMPDAPPALKPVEA